MRNVGIVFRTTGQSGAGPDDQFTVRTVEGYDQAYELTVLVRSVLVQDDAVLRVNASGYRFDGNHYWVTIVCADNSVAHAAALLEDEVLAPWDGEHPRQ